VTAPFAGTVVAWKVEDGDRVEEGQAVATVEAMKMERTVSSPADGVLSITAQAGQAVTAKETLATVATEETAG
ncbi:MAG: acetyl-CoA carboxylase biotin carboxyl carrier protein subunit, partial [Corynebacterium sp.]|nr:acetyl-CoA carboxylase biotin carboxyl carrier protein subunit [Corynebacterium sp.]